MTQLPVGGPAATTYRVTSRAHVAGRVAVPAYLVTDGRAVEGGPSQQVYYVSDAEIAAGEFVVAGDVHPIPIVAASNVNTEYPPIPIYVLNPQSAPASQWWITDPASLAPHGGVPASTFADNNVLNAGANPGLTTVYSTPQHGIRQDGIITQVKVRINQVGLGAFTTRQWRKNGSSYDYIDQSVDSVTQIGTNIITLSHPLTCQIGDVLGYFILGNANDALCVKVSTGTGMIVYALNDIHTNGYSWTGPIGYGGNFEALGPYPIFAVTGDSLAAGFTAYQGYYDLGVVGYDVDNDPWHMLQGLVSPDFQYQNHGKGNQTFAWVLSTGIISALATNAKYILIHCGVNDVGTGRTWAQVESDLDAIKLLVDAAPAPTRVLLIDEILPWTAGSDANALKIRTWNASLAAWCTTNGARLVSTHDAMGKVRVSTGELDDLKVAYDDDGVHLTVAGYAALAALVKVRLP